MGRLLQDLRYVLRSLRAAPGFTLIAVLTLALGIGANTAIFSVINTVLLKPLSFPEPDRMVSLLSISKRGRNPGGSPTKYNVWRTQTDVLQDVSAYKFGAINVTGGETPEQVPAAQVSEGFFRLFGSSLVMGRGFTLEEDRPNGPKVVVISDGLWRRLGAPPGILSKTISLNGEARPIVGVLGPNLDKSIDQAPDVLEPFQIDPESTNHGHYFRVSARLKSGVSLEQANARLKLAASEFRAKYPLWQEDTFAVERMQDDMVRNVRPSLLILAGAVGLVLLIACANVASLMLVRASVRRREIAVRAALGAGRWDLIRQQLTESVVLSLAGATLGLMIGSLGIRALLAQSPGNIPRIGENGTAVSPDLRVLLFTLGIAVLTGVAFGLVPALASSKADLNTPLKESSSRTGSGFRQNKARAAMVIVETGLALVLLIGSALLIRTFLALRSVQPGYETHNILTMRMSLTGERFQKTAGVEQIVRQGLDRVRALPGVETVSASCCVPLEGGYGLPFDIVGRPHNDQAGGGWMTVAPGYFEVFRIPVIRGRTFSDRDNTAGTPVVIINQTMAKKYWPDADPLNDQIVIGKLMGPVFADPPRQIVGLVGDVRSNALSDEPFPTMYIPNAQVPDAITKLNSDIYPLAWVIRTRVEPHSLSLVVQNELRQASGGLPVGRVRSMDEIVVRSTARQDFNMLLLSIFGGLALVLAAIGIYGLMAFTVEQRTQEIGIRMALGAGTGALRGMVVRQGMLLAFIGIVLGIFAAYGLTRLLTAFLFGVKPVDPLVFAAVPIVLALVSLAAIWVPASRATRVDPALALRRE
jgi:putative ABC transport system permease protein